MFRLFSIFIFWLTGWQVKGDWPEEKKFIAIGAPHTSYWDFFVGLCARSITRYGHFRYIVKQELFDNPFTGWFMKLTGGVPVDRSKSTNFVDAVVEIFNREERFALALMPEGTRKKVTRIKTGFYWMAVGAKIPIVMVGMDFGNKAFDIQPAFYPTGDIDKDMEFMLSYFRQVKGCYPEQGLQDFVYDSSKEKSSDKAG